MNEMWNVVEKCTCPAPARQVTPRRRRVAVLSEMWRHFVWNVGAKQKIRRDNASRKKKTPALEFLLETIISQEVKNGALDKFRPNAMIFFKSMHKTRWLFYYARTNLSCDKYILLPKVCANDLFCVNESLEFNFLFGFLWNEPNWNRRRHSQELNPAVTLCSSYFPFLVWHIFVSRPSIWGLLCFPPRASNSRCGQGSRSSRPR